MTAPALSAARFAAGCVLGAILGLIYGFLRPLRPRFTTLADGVFILAAGWAWLYLGFAVCRGDLRLGYTASLVLGGMVWELTVGRLLRPVFRLFWRGITLPVRKNLKKVSYFFKKVFASGKKIGYNKME